MSGLLGGEPEKVTPPPVPEPAPLPTVDDKAGDEVAKAEQRKSGASSAFLVGNLTPKSTGKKRFLG